jgi:glucose/arabinose dehydrogenase
MKAAAGIGMIFLVSINSVSFLNAQVFPPDFAQQLVVNGITNPTAMAFAPDGRIFVAEQAGKLRVVKNNILLPNSFVTLTVSSTGERGLIGIVLDPDFTTNKYIYLYYTVPGSPAHNRISRFTANGDVAQSGSESIVLELDPLSAATNHNGGAMHFGQDGKLYIAIGENANSAHAQNLDTYHGKLLRINKDGSVPENNPFLAGSEQRKRIWAYGLRNPYTFSVHPASGRILVNDVGQVTWEEVNDATTGGRNFGWPTTEGNFSQTTYPNFTNPIYSYQHGSGDGKGCALTGGTFFYPQTTNYPSIYLGRYFLQDYCNNWINNIDPTQGVPVRSAFATAIQSSSLAVTVGNDGNLYFLSRNTNALYKIIYNKTTIPYITDHPKSATVGEGQQVSFSVSALGTVPFTYQWQKDGVDIPGATNPNFSIANPESEDAGQYRVIVSNSAGNTSSSEATLLVIENALPIAEIITPAVGSTYIAGTTIDFSGGGIDAEDGVLPPSAFSWQINFHHDTHKHDQPPITGVPNGIFAIPNEGETSANVFYRIILTVIDSHGLIGKDSIDIQPEKSTISFVTDPPGLQITIDGQPFVAPVEVISVEGILRSIGVATPQLINNNVTYEFESWSNGGTLNQTLITPSEDVQLTATFSTIVGTEDERGSEAEILLYPNPVQEGLVTVTISSKQKQEVTIRLVDLLSRDVERLDQSIQPGKHNIPFYVEKKRKGIYYVIVKLKDESVVKKLVIIEQ